MKATKKRSSGQQFIKFTGVIIMCLCLFFLTGINFVVFPQHETAKKESIANRNGSTEKDPSAPVEEKSASNNSLTVQEEYLHERHISDESAQIEMLQHHKNLEVEKLQVVHFELISPPPDPQALL